VVYRNEERGLCACGLDEGALHFFLVSSVLWQKAPCLVIRKDPFKRIF
jgi:hypothetical protein